MRKRYMQSGPEKQTFEGVGMGRKNEELLQKLGRLTRKENGKGKKNGTRSKENFWPATRWGEASGEK